MIRIIRGRKEGEKDDRQLPLSFSPRLRRCNENRVRAKETRERRGELLCHLDGRIPTVHRSSNKLTDARSSDPDPGMDFDKSPLSIVWTQPLNIFPVDPTIELRGGR